MAGHHKTPFYLVMTTVVAGLATFAVCRADGAAPTAQPQEPGKTTAQPIGQNAESANGTAPVTTVKEYSFKPAERLPEIKQTSRYKPINGQHRPPRPERLGRLGPHHSSQQRDEA